MFRVHQLPPKVQKEVRLLLHRHHLIAKLKMKNDETHRVFEVLLKCRGVHRLKLG